jgi:hypothetical protein
MFRAESTLAPPAPHGSNNFLVPLPFFALNPVESALPQNQILHFANPIESIPFFQIVQFRANSAPVSPAYTTLTKPAPRNPIRMNTSTKHHVAPPHATIVTISYKRSYRKIHNAWSYHFPHANRPCPTAPSRRVTPIESHCFMNVPSKPFRMILFHKYPGGGGSLGFSNQKFRMGAEGGTVAETSPAPPPFYQGSQQIKCAAISRCYSTSSRL